MRGWEGWERGGGRREEVEGRGIEGRGGRREAGGGGEGRGRWRGKGGEGEVEGAVEGEVEVRGRGGGGGGGGGRERLNTGNRDKTSKINKLLGSIRKFTLQVKNLKAP